MSPRRLLAVLLLSVSLSTVAAPLELYVAPNGDDRAAGTADHPLATLQRARDEIRQRKPAGATVHVAGGSYVLKEPLILLPEDSGTPEAPIVYEAAAGETPILSGGVAITGWKTNAAGQWEVTLPAVQRGEWDFTQLFVNGTRRYRPRLPKSGYYTIAGELPPTEAAKKHGYDRFTFKPGEIKSEFHNLGDVEALCFSNWFMSRLRIASVDDAQHAVTFTGPTPSTDDYGKLHAGWRYLLENVREALHDPGEWYLDRKTGVLTYVPMPGEEIGKTEVIAPKLEQFLRIQGDPAKHQWVRDVTFRGLAFEYANWVTPAKGYAAAQAEYPLRGVIDATGARRCTFERCRVEHIGAYAVQFDNGCKANRVEQCVLSDLGAGGVRLGNSGMNPDPEQNASANRLVNNLILHGGRMHPGAIGVFVQHSPDNLVQHNEIADFYYTGISSGWTWGYDKSLATGNQYLDNFVHQIGQGVLSDMGGIYTLGNHAGSVIRGNRFDDIWAYSYGGWGIYFDEGTTGLVAEDNWVRHTKTGGFHQHYGKDNLMRNNVLVDGYEQWLERTRIEPDHTSFTFERNVVIGHRPTVFKGNWHEKLVVDHNVYWRPEGMADFDGNPDFATWQKRSGVDAHSVFADPQFVDGEHGDFHLKPGSPAAEVGFKPFDAREAGVTGEMKNVARPSAPEGFPTVKRPWSE